MSKDLKRVLGIAAGAVVVLAIAAMVYQASQDEERATRAAEQAAIDDSIFIRPHSRTRGPVDAPVTVVEFFDPECEACRAMHPAVDRILAEYPDRVRLVLRYMPLHRNSIYAAGALEAAGAQGKFWEMLDALFLHQPEWGDHHAPRPEKIPDYARDLGLDMVAFQRVLDAGAYKELVAADRADGVKLGVRGTPSFFVNEQPLIRLGHAPLKAMIEDALER